MNNGPSKRDTASARRRSGPDASASSSRKANANTGTRKTATRKTKTATRKSVRETATRKTGRKRSDRGEAERRVLTIDVGGSSVKFLASGETEVRMVRSGPKMTPTEMVDAVRERIDDWNFDVISLGYPGLVSASGPVTEPANLGKGWVGFDFEAAFGCPLRIVNDATMQALGSYDGGRMLFLGFGTGIGSVLIVDRTVVPLELGELKWKGKTLYEQFGSRGFEELGERRWRKRVLDLIPSLQRAFLVDYIVVGGGNSKYVLEPLPPNVRIGHNLTAFRGGHRLWDMEMPDLDDGGSRSSLALGEWRLL